MDTELLVEAQIEDGRKLIAELVRDGFDVAVAFWAQSSEDGKWSLYISSTSVEAAKIGDAYRIVYGAFARITDPWISFSEVKPVPATNPIAILAKELRDRGSGRAGTTYRGARLRDLSIEEVYIYPAVELPKSAYLTVDAVKNIEIQNGELRVDKMSFSMPKEGLPLRETLEWVSDVKIKDNQMIVEKVNIKNSPQGLKAEYLEEVCSPVPKSIVVKQGEK